MAALRRTLGGPHAGGATSIGRLCSAVAIAAVIGVAGLVPATTSMSATPGLVAAYGFDEGSGSAVADASGAVTMGRSRTRPGRVRGCTGVR